jgi:heme-degrading monooxygenase HmoA
MIGVSITVMLKGKDEEERFLAAFTTAMEAAGKVPGLQDLKACKVLGRDYCYHLFTLWESEAAIEAWVQHPRYRAMMLQGGQELVAAFESYRWQPVRPPLRRP